jgi:hypothetical protein
MALAVLLVAVGLSASGAHVPAAAAVATGKIKWGGVAGDVPVAADYTGDGRTDIAIYRPASGNWYVRGMTYPIQWGGQVGDQPVPADYDGDRKADLAVVRRGSDDALYWYIRYSRGGTERIRWGVRWDEPVPADYNGDGRAEPAVIRHIAYGSSGALYWYIRGWAAPVRWGGWAVYADETGDYGWDDEPVPADYNGDGRTDIAVLRNCQKTSYYCQDGDERRWVWHIRRLSTISWLGGSTLPYEPVPAKYTGQSHDILAYFNQWDGMWHVRGHYSVRWGQAGDIPQVGNYGGNAKADQVIYRPSTGYWWIRWEA